MNALRTSLLLLILPGTIAAACGKRPGPSGTPGSLDLGAAFSAAAATPSTVRDFALARAGERRTGTALIAPARLVVPVDVPRGLFDFRCFAAPVYNVGDGTNLEVHWEYDGGRRKIFARSFDAARRFEGRRWTAISVPLEVAGQGGRLVLEVSGGAGGDMAADWLVVAEPRLVPGAGGR